MNRFFVRVLLLLVTATVVLAGGAWAADPAISLGSASGSVGTTVTIPVTLTTNGIGISSASTDIGYNTTLLSNPTATIGAGVASGFTLSTNTVTPGVIKIAFFNLSNANTLGDGVLANVTFTVAGAGSSTLTNLPAATDVEANDLVVAGSNGTITGIGLAQSISFSAPSLSFHGTAPLSATATSGLSVSFTSLTPSVCSVSGSTVTSLTGGTCTVAASQAGNLTFNAATPVNQNIVIAKASQTIDFPQPAAMTFGAPAAIGATATSGLAVTLTSNSTGVCTVDTNNIVTPVTGGDCAIVASQAGNADFLAAAPVSRTITIAKAVQTVTIDSVPALTYRGTAGTVSASTTSGLTSFSFGSSTPAVCTVAGNSVTPVAAGTCTITATQAGDARFGNASVSRSFEVAKANQTITFSPVPTLNFGASAAVHATVDSPLAVSYTSTTTDVCSVNATSGLVTPLSTGTCTIAANQAGDVNFNQAAEVTASILIGKANQTVSFVSVPSLAFQGGSGTISATASSTLTPVTFSSSTQGVCTVSGSTVTPVAAGTCTITAVQAGDSNFNEAQASTVITIAKAPQVISFGAAPALTFGATAQVSATADSGSTAIVFSSKTLDVCTVDTAGVVTPVSAGKCTIAANLAASDNFSAALEKTQDIQIAQAAQSITFSAPATIKFSDSLTLTAAAAPGLQVAFSSSTPTVCTIGVTSGVVTPKAAGECSITAEQAGSINFLPATPVTRGFSITAVAPGVPTAVSAIPADTKATVSFTVPASNGGSTITGYTVTSSPEGITATGTGNKIEVTGLTNGTAYTFTVTATNAAGTSAASAASTQVIPNILTATVGAPSVGVANAAATVSYTVTYTGAESITLAAGDVTVATTGTAQGTVVSVSGTDAVSRTVTIGNLTGDGTVGISIKAGTAVNGAIVAQPSEPSATFTVDNTAAALAVATLANNSITSNKTLSVGGTVSDLLSGIATVTVNDAPVTVATDGSFSTALTLNEGANIITVVATDLAGNKQTDTRTVSFDTTGPQIAPLTPAENSFTNLQAVTLSGTLNKRGTVTVAVNGGTAVAAPMNDAGTGFSIPVTLTVGANTIDIVATNVTTDGTATTTSSYQRHITFDSSKPALAITEPVQDITTVLSSMEIAGTVTDDTGITLSCQLDGAALAAPAVSAGAFAKTITFSQAKSYALTVTATDQAGNTSTVQRNIVYRPISLSDALRALRIGIGLETATDTDKGALDVGPMLNGKPNADGTIDISDAVVLLNYFVGNF